MTTQPAEIGLPLFERFPGLREALPRVSLGAWPTPVTGARHFAAAHRLGALYVKREDLSHPECAGNKVRGLEFVIAEAKRRGAKTIVTFSTVGSHHIAKTAWHARRFGIDTVAIVLPQPSAHYVEGNIRTGLAAGARYVPASYLTLLPKLALEMLRARRDGSGGVYYLPAGGSSLPACVGHVSAAFELKRQIEAGELPEPDYLYVALGSLGTAAGLLVGCKLAGLRTRLVGVVTSYRWYCTPRRWARLAHRITRFMRRLDPSLPETGVTRFDVSVIGTALGRGYARPTDEATRLMGVFREAEGIELDSTYTAKTLDGAMQFIDRGRLHGKTHLFWHTYQAPLAEPAV
ncbi:MAG: pyridoxal-phosphate dependent enzyme [Planctomycetota bacterium]